MLKSKLLLLPLPPPLHLLVLLLNEAFSLGKWVRLIRPWRKRFSLFYWASGSSYAGEI